MLPKFYNRERELEYLEGIYKEKGFKLIVLYGRRRVGKTELIKRFIENKKSVYLLATEESLLENIKSLKKKFYEVTGKDYFLQLQTESFYDLFKHFVEEIKNERIVLVIDEFPYLLSLKKGILSLFQKIIDELLISTNIVLLLCGSSISIMESEVLGHRTPLYGRNLNSWKVNPFSFPTVFRAVGNIEKAIQIYSVFGGVPYYLKFYNKNASILENIKSNLLLKGRNLYDEPLILMKQEFRESRIYRLILKYISLGYKSLGKLCSAIGMDKTNVMKYLSTLEEVGIVKHIVPFGMKRKGIYEISDNFFRFWFRFVYPRRDMLEIGSIQPVMKEIRNHLNHHIGGCFEYLIEELLKTRTISVNFDLDYTGRWWWKDREIDIIGLNERTKEILFCECKWQDRVNPERVLRELEEKSKYVDWEKEKRKESFGIFAKSFRKKISEWNGRPVYCWDLRDLEMGLGNGKV